MLGGPVGPGVTTGRAAVFVARTTRDALRRSGRCSAASRAAAAAAAGARSTSRSRKLTAGSAVAVARRGDDPPGQERPPEGRAERAGRARLPRRRAAPLLLERGRLPHEAPALARGARLRARARPGRRRADGSSSPIGVRAGSGHAICAGPSRASLAFGSSWNQVPHEPASAVGTSKFPHPRSRTAHELRHPLAPARPAPAAADRARLPAAAAPAGALRRPLHEPRRARERRRQHPLLAAPRRPRALPARPDGAARRLRAAEHDAAGRPRGGDDRARDRRLGLDAGRGRRADAARGGTEGRPRLHEGPARSGSRSASSRSRRRRRSPRPRPRTGSSPSTRSTFSTRSAAPRSATRSRAASRSPAPPSRAERAGTARPAAILLLSDGSQTEGILLPMEGAARAKSFKIPVYTVALGTPEGVVEFTRFGGTRIIPVPPDKATMRQIAVRRPAAASTRRRAPATCARRTTRWGRS